MNVEPYQNRLLVKRLADSTRTEGGIMLPDGIANKQTYVAEVLAVGPGRRDFNGVLWPPQSKVGDKVIFLRTAGSNIGMDSEKLTLVTEEDVLGRVVDAQP